MGSNLAVVTSLHPKGQAGALVAQRGPDEKTPPQTGALEGPEPQNGCAARDDSVQVRPGNGAAPGFRGRGDQCDAVPFAQRANRAASQTDLDKGQPPHGKKHENNLAKDARAGPAGKRSSPPTKVDGDETKRRARGCQFRPR